MKTPIDDFIANYPKDIQAILEKIRQTIKQAAPKATETISYDIPTFDQNGKHLVHFSAYKHHIGFYPTSSGIAKFKNELSAYKSAKGSVQFPLNKPIPYTLIKRITEFRVKEIREKTP
jgi:uncharacterized protein YdhG (YjbR/CyaY superfamily)